MTDFFGVHMTQNDPSKLNNLDRQLSMDIDVSMAETTQLILIENNFLYRYLYPFNWHRKMPVDGNCKVFSHICIGASHKSVIIIIGEKN